MELEHSSYLGDLVAQHLEASISRSPDVSLVPFVQKTGLPELCLHNSKGPVFFYHHHPALWPHQENKKMAYEKSIDFFEIARSMFEYPWLEYPNRTKGEAGMERNRIRGKGLKRKAPWLPSQAGV